MKQFNNLFLFIFILLLPTQLGKHFFFDFSYISGVRVDYLAPTLFVTDLLAAALITLNLKPVLAFLRQKKVLVLIAVLLFNVLLSGSHPLSFYRHIKVLELIGIFAIFREGKFSKPLILSGFLLGGLFELFIALTQYINRHSLQGLFYFFGERPLNLSMPGIAKASLNGIEILRPYGTFSHPNSMSGFYLAVYFFTLTLKNLSNTWVKNLLLLLCSLLIFISFSKIAILTFLILNFAYLWNSPLKKSCKFCFFSRIIILTVVSFIFLQAASDRFTLQKRILLMQNSLQIIADNPFSGVGLGKYLPAQQQFPQNFADFLNQPVHNIFLLFAAEVGILTCLFVFWLFRSEVKKIFTANPYLFIAVLLTGLFDHYWLTLQQNFLLIGVVVGML